METGSNQTPDNPSFQERSRELDFKDIANLSLLPSIEFREWISLLRLCGEAPCYDSTKGCLPNNNPGVDYGRPCPYGLLRTARQYAFLRRLDADHQSTLRSNLLRDLSPTSEEIEGAEPFLSYPV
jgi:hypothetical protein